MNIYTTHITREEDRWTITMDEVPGLSTQVRWLGQIPGMVRDALTLFLEVEASPDQTQISVIPDLTYVDKATMVIEPQHAPQTAQEKVTIATHATAKDPYHSGLTYRDTGELLKVSFRHAQKLVSIS